MAALPLALLLGTTAACGGSGSQTQCGTDGCTITFPRGGDATVSVLGIDAKLVGVQDGTATVQVAGQQVSIPVGAETQSGQFLIGVEQVTDTEVIVRVRLA